MRRLLSALCFGVGVNLFVITAPVLCDTPSKNAQDLDISPEIIKNSPVLQRWRRQVPNVLEDIKNDPSFSTKIRVGSSYFSSEKAFGVNIGVEDLFIGRTSLTVSGEYQAVFNGQRQVYGADLHYYLRPLGSYINITPVVGYRHLEIDSYSTDGVNLGAKLLLVLSRGGAGDISLTQSWVGLGTGEEVGLTTISVGYALTSSIRISTDIEQQNSKQNKETRLGIVFEWLP
ncbi:hypothetical protein DP113_24660 [Brasilonema octagenarum UFV-E1]|uniref:Uncharacterized protein n=1 Tax=Brasilonema sennae CENA114 TaxID=415709 RepID=A0A856MKK8_9CYAN|nr:hypothetical protein [Brasilonema sennae]QDL10680.1 hypothetical protein DP114_24745 [Brasilonema sennae CENA114]QDL17027.1 hypothetical protein DP113_24660 [Brasilonema octagenarum UFV-E1]